jgi:RNA polymerase primary sigma factor/RNA polymerase sigma factor
MVCNARERNRSKASVRRILTETRVRHIFDLPLDYVPHEQFKAWEEDKNAEKEILRPMPEPSRPMPRPSAPAGSSPYMAALYDVPLLTREQELHLFRKMNYLKYKASKLRHRLNLVRPRKALVERIETLYQEIVDTKKRLVRANLRLVTSIARRYVTPTGDFFELVSDGNVSLIQAVERFDFSREARFSTYATWAIVKNYKRMIYRSLRRRCHFRPACPDAFAAIEDARANPQEIEAIQAERESTVDRILGQLNQREHEIIVCRFGLRGGEEPLSLRELGVAMGVTKERIRQIQIRAMTKLLAAAETIDASH